jgi:hypothetical protein
LIKEKFQRAFTHQIEDVLFRVLCEDFRRLPWKDMRRCAFLVVGNYARQFINALPMMDTWCLGDELAEMYATYFGMPSPACAPYVDKRILGPIGRDGRRKEATLRKYGHALTSTNWLQGGHTHTRHDRMKWTIGTAMQQSYPGTVVEAMGLFNDCISDPNYWRSSRGERQRQGICPDFLIPRWNLGRDQLFELKTMGYPNPDTENPANYSSKKSNQTRRHAVNQRERRIQSEYFKKARKADRDYNGTPEGVQGPIEQRLSQYGPIFGLVIGGFGEVNDNMDVLVTRLATRAAESKWRLMGALSLAQARQTFKARIRRTIGVEAARGLARLRLANLVNVHSFQPSESAASLRQREKSYYYDARETHYNRFGPHAWFDPGMRGRTHR